MKKNIVEYTGFRKIGHLAKENTPIKIMLVSDDPDIFNPLIDVVKYYPRIGRVKDSFSITLKDLNDWWVNHWITNDWKGMIRTKFK